MNCIELYLFKYIGPGKVFICGGLILAITNVPLLGNLTLPAYLLAMPLKLPARQSQNRHCLQSQRETIVSISSFLSKCFPGVPTTAPIAWPIAQESQTDLLSVGAMSSSTTMLSSFAHRLSFPLYVSKEALHNATDTGLCKLPLRMFKGVRRKVLVESSSFSRSESLFFAPFPQSESCLQDGPVPTEFAAVPSRTDTKHIVSTAHDFEIRLVGMHLSAEDGFESSSLKHILYSISSESSEELKAMKYDSGHHSEWSNSSYQYRVLEGHTFPDHIMFDKEEPIIHYDPVYDGHGECTSTNSFIAIPSRKSLLHRHAGSSQEAQENSLSVRFALLEIDTVKYRRRKPVQNLGAMFHDKDHDAKSTTFDRGISSVMRGIESTGQMEMEDITKTGRVLSKDVEFLLCEKKPSVANSLRNKKSISDEKEKESKHADQYLRVRTAYKSHIHSPLKRSSFLDSILAFS